MSPTNANVQSFPTHAHSRKAPLEKVFASTLEQLAAEIHPRKISMEAGGGMAVKLKPMALMQWLSAGNFNIFVPVTGHRILRSTHAAKQFLSARLDRATIFEHRLEAEFGGVQLCGQQHVHHGHQVTSACVPNILRQRSCLPAC